jgi:hypothetical protein
MMAPGRFCVTFKGAWKMEAAKHSGLLVRGFPVEFRPISKYTWVNVTRLSYGVPEVEITKVLSGFGEIKKISSEVYSHIYTGVRHVLMEIRQRLCFGCGQEGHNRSDCPSRVRPEIPAATTSSPVPRRRCQRASPPDSRGQCNKAFCLYRPISVRYFASNSIGVGKRKPIRVGRVQLTRAHSNPTAASSHEASPCAKVR